MVTEQLVETIRAFFREHPEYTPEQEVYLDGKACCGLTALAAQTGKLDLTNQSGYVGIIETAAKEIGLSDAFHRGFIGGWDKTITPDELAADEEPGYHTGRKAWRLVQEDRGVKCD